MDIQPTTKGCVKCLKDFPVTSGELFTQTLCPKHRKELNQISILILGPHREEMAEIMIKDWPQTQSLVNIDTDFDIISYIKNDSPDSLDLYHIIFLPLVDFNKIIARDKLNSDNFVLAQTLFDSGWDVFDQFEWLLGKLIERNPRARIILYDELKFAHQPEHDEFVSKMREMQNKGIIYVCTIFHDSIPTMIMKIYLGITIKHFLEKGMMPEALKPCKTPLPDVTI